MVIRYNDYELKSAKTKRQDHLCPAFALLESNIGLVFKHPFEL
jgi:hypothetical protein